MTTESDIAPSTSSDAVKVSDADNLAHLNIEGLGFIKPPPSGQIQITEVAQLTLNPLTPLQTLAPQSFQNPTDKEVDAWAPIKTVPDNILTPSDIAEIDADLATYLDKIADRRLAYYLLARACYDNGSSPFTQYPGKYQIGEKVITLDQLANTVRKVVPIRRFARFWAKTIYSIAKAKNEPPTKWAQKGFSFQTRFAAFDFFDAVVSPHTPVATGVPKAVPTNEEIAANNTSRSVLTYRSNNSYLRNLQPEVTGGGLCQPRPVTYGAGSCGR